MARHEMLSPAEARSAIFPARAAALVGEGSRSAMLPARARAAIEAGPVRAGKVRSCYARLNRTTGCP